MEAFTSSISSKAMLEAAKNTASASFRQSMSYFTTSFSNKIVVIILVLHQLVLFLFGMKDLVIQAYQL